MDAVNHARASVTPAAVVAPGRPLPAEMPAAMPVQHLHQWGPTERVWPDPPSGRARRRRTLVLTCVLALTAGASYEMYRVLTVHSMTTLQLAFLVLFTLTFVWIALPCVCGLAGLLALWRGRSVSGLSLPPLHPLPALTTRTALVMPIYNEDPSRIFAGLQAIYESLDALGAMASFDFFILSDTTDPEVWLEEERAGI